MSDDDKCKVMNVSDVSRAEQLWRDSEQLLKDLERLHEGGDQQESHDA